MEYRLFFCQSKEGLTLIGGTNAEFTQVLEETRKISGLVHQIAQASTEQAKGIEQVNQAIIEIESVTQSAAASAEESAAVSEDMRNQTENLSSLVVKLTDIVDGSGGGKSLR